MPGKDFFKRLASEMGVPSVQGKQQFAYVKIHHNVVIDYWMDIDAKAKQKRKKALSEGYNVSHIPLEQAKRLMGKRFQEMGEGNTLSSEDAESET